MRFRDALRLRAAAAACAGMLALCMFAFLALSGYFALSARFIPVYAALITAGGCLLAALAILLATRLITTRRREYRNSGAHAAEAFEHFLEDGVDPVTEAWIRRHPDAAVAVTLTLGIAAGYSGSIRRILQDLYVHYANAEAQRQSSRRGPPRG
jgi:hypothetical protein